MGIAEGVSSLGTMLDLIDTPEQDMFTLSIENDSSQSEFLICLLYTSDAADE